MLSLPSEMGVPAGPLPAGGRKARVTLLGDSQTDTGRILASPWTSYGTSDPHLKMGVIITVLRVLLKAQAAGFGEAAYTQ